MELLLPILVLIPLFLIFNRQRKQQREQTQLRESVREGQRVMTTAGMFGTVVGVDGNTMKLEIAPGVVVEYVTGALARIMPTADEAVDTDPQPGTSDAGSPGVIDLDKGTQAPRPNNQA